MTDYDAIDFFRGNELVIDPYPYFDWLRAQCRVTTELGGVEIPAGTTVMVVNGAANRDPRRFEFAPRRG